VSLDSKDSMEIELVKCESDDIKLDEFPLGFSYDDLFGSIILLEASAYS